jgi:hypothetical protein
VDFSAFRKLFFSLALWATVRPSQAQENPYIVLYDHNLEEAANLESEYCPALGTQCGGPNYHAYWMEFECGVSAWWASKLYLSGQSTFADSSG